MCTARHSDTQTPGAADLSVDENPDQSAHRRRGRSTEFRASFISEHKESRRRIESIASLLFDSAPSRLRG
jgi:hypothetical protein